MTLFEIIYTSYESAPNRFFTIRIVISICPHGQNLSHLLRALPNPQNTMTLTLEDIARLAGCSRSTVSRVINGDVNVSVATRQRVKKVINGTEFSTQPGRPRTGFRADPYPGFDHSAEGHLHFFRSVLPAVDPEHFHDDAAREIIPSCCGWPHLNLNAAPSIRFLYNGLIDGVIGASMSLTDPIIQSLAESNLPFVAIGRNPMMTRPALLMWITTTAPVWPSIICTKWDAGGLPPLPVPSDVIVGFDRLRGYRDALAEHGLEFDPELVVVGDFSDAGGYAAMQKLMTRNRMRFLPPAILWQWLPSGLWLKPDSKFPKMWPSLDLMILPWLPASIPALTTIRQPIELMGAQSVNMLLDLIEHPSTATRSLILPTELVIRSSCGEELVKVQKNEHSIASCITAS